MYGLQTAVPAQEGIVQFPRVRLAMPSDETDIYELCCELHKENGLFPMHRPKIEASIQQATTRTGALMGLIGPPGSVEGMIYLLISSMWYTDRLHLEEIFNFVRPKYRRGTTNARALITFAKSCADAVPLPLLIGIISSEQTEAKIRLYKKFLGLPIGAFFLYGEHVAIKPVSPTGWVIQKRWRSRGK